MRGYKRQNWVRVVKYIVIREVAKKSHANVLDGEGDLVVLEG